MKKSLIILLLFPVFLFAQDFSKSELLSISDLKSTELLMYKKGMRNISREESIDLFELKYKSLKNTSKDCESSSSNCDWISSGFIIYSNDGGNYWKYLSGWGDYDSNKLYKRNDFPFNKYDKRYNTKSIFTYGYSSVTKEANSFVEINFSKTERKNTGTKWDRNTLNIKVQYNNLSDFQKFKNNIISFSKYEKTYKSIDGYQSALFTLDNSTFEYTNLIEFTIYQDDNIGYISINFKQYKNP